MGFLTVMLFPVLGPPGTTVGAGLFMAPFLGGFLYDWLTVSGVVRGRSTASVKLWRRSWEVVRDWVPLALRGAVVGVLSVWVYRTATDFTGQVAHYTAVGMPNPAVWLMVFAALEMFAQVMLALGAAGRTVAIGAIILAGVRLQFDPFEVAYWVLIPAYTGLIFLGSGKFSLWKPEDKLIFQRAGERR